MKLDKPHCPACGKLADRITEQVLFPAGIRMHADGTFDYDEGAPAHAVAWEFSEIHEWSDGHFELGCSCGHVWDAWEVTR